MSTMSAKMNALGAGHTVDVSKISATQISGAGGVSTSPRPIERQVQLG